MNALRVVITGRVQGVFFRAQAKVKADGLGVKGWVRNAEDGSVEIHAEGPEEALKKFIEWCKEGPPMAQVQQMAMSADKMTGAEEFEIRT